MDTQSEINENNNIEINVFPKHHRKMQNGTRNGGVHINNLLGDKEASMDLQQGLMPALQNMYKIPEGKQFMLLQPLLNMYIQNKYFGELLKKSQSVFIEDLVKMEQPSATDTITTTSTTTTTNTTIPATPIELCPPPQDQPLDLSIKTTKRSQNDMYHSFSDVLNLSSYHTEAVVASFKSKSKRSRFKSPAAQGMTIDSFSNLQVPSSSATESDPDFSNILQNIVKEEDANFSCHICGQAFGIQDRLAKHVASCHKARKKQNDSTKTYECEVCKRSFARSDMLTRHSRLHTGKSPFLLPATLPFTLFYHFLPGHARTTYTPSCEIGEKRKNNIC